jgi:hypothetical protein
LVDEHFQRICFRRHKAELEWPIENEWRMLKPDLTMTKLISEEAGYVKYGLKIEKAAVNKT